MVLTLNSKTEICTNFYEIWQLEQIGHANYEYRIYLELTVLTQNYEFRQIRPQIEMCPMFTNFDTQN